MERKEPTNDYGHADSSNDYSSKRRNTTITQIERPHGYIEYRMCVPDYKPTHEVIPHLNPLERALRFADKVVNEIVGG